MSISETVYFNMCGNCCKYTQVWLHMPSMKTQGNTSVASYSELMTEHDHPRKPTHTHTMFYRAKPWNQTQRSQVFALSWCSEAAKKLLYIVYICDIPYEPQKNIHYLASNSESIWYLYGQSLLTCNMLC